MYTADNLIDKIVRSSRVPSGRKRREIARELRAHIEDFILIAREGGNTEEEVRRLVAANFGDPQEIADEFAAVYRRERTILCVSVFLLSTLAAATVISAIVLGLQVSMAVGLGVPVSSVFGGHHLKLETLYIFCTVAAYIGLLSLEKLFGGARLPKAAALLALLFTVAGAGLSVIGFTPETAVAAFVSGTLLRAVQVYLKSGAARIGAALACFGSFGLFSACRQSPGPGNTAALQLIVWLAIGICGHLMTSLSERVDRALSDG